ncbi:MAG: response regulator transcription factor [Treponema sp.]|nr:response regulator transcription factor [Treponema sp.]
MNSADGKTLILVDDHEMIQIGLRTFLESKTDWTVIGEAKTIETAIEILEKKQPLLIIIDVELGEENGFDLAVYIKKNYPSVKILMYSMHDESDYVLKAKQIQINGYISKASDTEEFIKCINSVYAGNKYIEERLKENQNAIEDVLNLLTKREALIFQEMLNGKTNEEIGKSLNLSKHSIEVYATTIYEKTFCKTRSELLKKFR